MKHYLLGSLLFFIAAASLTGCATHKVWQLGEYMSAQVPERAAILRDGRVVIDFSDERLLKTRKREHYYKRVYFFVPDALHAGGPEGDTSVKLRNDSIETRIFHYVTSANADEEKGNWEPALKQRRLPPITEMDPNNAVCSDFHASVSVPYKLGSKGLAYVDSRFTICNELKPAVQYREVKVKFDKERHAWWFYPSRFLYVPAIIFDIVTSPVQLAVAIYEINKFSVMPDKQ